MRISESDWTIFLQARRRHVEAVQRSPGRIRRSCCLRAKYESRHRRSLEGTRSFTARSSAGSLGRSVFNDPRYPAPRGRSNSRQIADVLASRVDVHSVVHMRSILSIPYTRESVMPITLTQQTALITGASRGIGRGIALKLAEQGVKSIAINYKSL